MGMSLYSLYCTLRDRFKGCRGGFAFIRAVKRIPIGSCFLLRKVLHINLLPKPVDRPETPVDWEACRRGEVITVFTSASCRYAAEVYAHHLETMGFRTVLTQDGDAEWGDGLHILVSAQVLKRLPKQYIVVQMEQLEVSSWYTLAYHRILENAIAIFDYNKANIAYLAERLTAPERLFYAPITVLPKTVEQTAPLERKYDVVFYGMMASHRRQVAVKKLQEHFNVKVITNMFGEALYRELRSSKIVVNIHQFDAALLETTRLYECLSYGFFVVSEDSSNSGDFPTLRENISWFDEGDWDAMIALIGKWLADDEAREEERRRRNARAVKEADTFVECFRSYLEAQ